MKPLTLAYYCSGHGFGHATRVSAFATHLRRQENSPTIVIVSSAPSHVFSQCIEAGALYRHADIDPVIVQPIAYHVDRRKSVEVLKNFVSQEHEKLVNEISWLQSRQVDCVLSDAAYLACKAASYAGIPSALITNFTFDSVYSYLSVVLSDSVSDCTLTPNKSQQYDKEYALWDDHPIPPELLEPYVSVLHSGYRCAQLLVLLPGNIPIPSFGITPSLPSHLWTDGNDFLPIIEDALSSDLLDAQLHPPVSICRTGKNSTLLQSLRQRQIFQSPLIVRHPSADIYTSIGRERLLDSIGVPAHLQSTSTKVLIVSFGGQIFRKPSSKASSRQPSRSATPQASKMQSPELQTPLTYSHEPPLLQLDASRDFGDDIPELLRFRSDSYSTPVAPIATSSHLWIPGAPPASRVQTTPTLSTSETIRAIPRGLTHICDESQQDESFFVLTPPTPGIDYIEELSSRSCSGSTACSDADTDSETVVDENEEETHLLPDSSWVAIVCGASGAAKGDDDELPDNFFVAPKDVYMPDLTAVADVLLGKLGYGTVSECVDACTPFVYVPRPLFIEEHGLRRLLTKSGVGVKLTREQYEAGDWAQCVEEAWEKGKDAKAHKRVEGDTGERRREGEEMAAKVLDWARNWQTS